METIAKHLHAMPGRFRLTASHQIELLQIKRMLASESVALHLLLSNPLVTRFVAGSMLLS